ncbi:MAG: aldo/keto reductase [Nocardioides sp.]|uniref:aldo/keto reductase n=1 Tax=Nocardioides sp. TaxID=35761 RepID=UPI0039E2D5E0
MAPSADLSSPGGTGALGGRAVARIGYGTMQLERLHADARAAEAVVRHAVEHGVNHFDTAQFYGDGFANGVLRATTPDDVVIATKVGADADPDGPVPLRPAQRPEELRASVEDNLRSLDRERIDLVYLRRLDAGPGLRATGDQEVPLDDQLATMSALREEGKIAAIGISGTTLDVVRRALPIGIAAVQNAYNLLSRDDEELLRLCEDEGIAWVPFFPLGSAFPQSPKVTDRSDVQHIATQLGATAAQVGLAWLLQHARGSLLVPGTISIAHLDENLAAGTLTLPEEAVSVLDAIG